MFTGALLKTKFEAGLHSEFVVTWLQLYQIFYFDSKNRKQLLNVKSKTKVDSTSSIRTSFRNNSNSNAGISNSDNAYNNHQNIITSEHRLPDDVSDYYAYLTVNNASELVSSEITSQMTSASPSTVLSRNPSVNRVVPAPVPVPVPVPNNITINKTNQVVPLIINGDIENGGITTTDTIGKQTVISTSSSRSILEVVSAMSRSSSRKIFPDVSYKSITEDHLEVTGDANPNV